MPGVSSDIPDIPINIDQQSGSLEFDGFKLDRARRKLSRAGETLSLNPKAFDLLVYLATNAGRVVTKEELMDAVWPEQYVEESNLKVQMSTLRKVLGESRSERRYLVTIPGKGYKFIADIQNEDREFFIESHRFSRVVVDEHHEKSPPEAGNRAFGSTSRSISRFLPSTRVGRIGVAAFAFLASLSGIVWLSSRPGGSDTVVPAVLAEKQTQIKRLTNKGTTNYAVLSPDGKFFAYSLTDKSAFRTSLWVGQTSGSSDSELLPAADLVYNPRSFSADGQWIYYTVSEPRAFDNGALYKVQVLGGVPQKLLSDVSVYVVLSPDEKKVAFIRRNKEKSSQSLVVANLDGSGEKVITVRPAGQGFNSYSLAWSADGSRVAFGASSGSEKSQEIFSANVADGTVKQVTSLNWSEISRLAWLRSRGIVVVARQATNSVATNQIWSVDPESGAANQIINDLQHYGSSLSLSADSNSLVAVQAIRESSIWIADAKDHSTARQLTFGSSGHEGWFGIDWTADGKIIYVARIDQSLTIWTIDPDGSNAKQITPVGFKDERPSATADGKYIVFQSNRSGASEIWRMNQDGSNLRQLTFEGSNSYPHSTPDGQTIVYTHTADGTHSARRGSIDGGESALISDRECFNARVSPDGKYVACGSRFGEKNKLALLPIAGGGGERWFDVPATYNFDGSIRWSRDGRFIVYRDWANGIWEQSIDGGDPRRVEGLPAEKLYQYDWSLDGKRVAFTRGRDVRDVVLISDFN